MEIALVLINMEVPRLTISQQEYTTTAPLFPGESAKDLARLTKHRQLLSGGKPRCGIFHTLSRSVFN